MQHNVNECKTQKNINKIKIKPLHKTENNTYNNL